MKTLLYLLLLFFLSNNSQAQFKPIKRDLKQLQLVNEYIKSAHSEKAIIYSLALAGLSKKSLQLILKDLKKVSHYPKLKLLNNQIMTDRKYSGIQFYLHPEAIISFKGQVFKYNKDLSFHKNYLSLKERLSKTIMTQRGLAEEDRTWKDHYNGIVTVAAILTGFIHYKTKNKFPQKKDKKPKSSVDVTANIMQFLMIPIEKNVSVKDDNNALEDFYEESRIRLFTKNFGKSLKCNPNYLSFTTNDKHFILVTKEMVPPKEKSKLMNMEIDLSHSLSGLNDLNEEEQKKLLKLIEEEKSNQSQDYTVTIYNKKIERVDIADDKKNYLRDLASFCDSNENKNILLKHYKDSSVNFLEAYSQYNKTDEGKK